MRGDLTTRSDAAHDHVAALEAIEARLGRLSSWTIHNANPVRDSRDGLKVDGRQTTCASTAAMMIAPSPQAPRPRVRVAVKPYAGPVLRAVHYLLCSQALEDLQVFRAMGSSQGYPNSTKGIIPGDFSTGGGSRGVANTAFAIAKIAGLEDVWWKLAAFTNNFLARRCLNKAIPATDLGGSFISPGQRSQIGAEAGLKF